MELPVVSGTPLVREPSVGMHSQLDYQGLALSLPHCQVTVGRSSVLSFRLRIN